MSSRNDLAIAFIIAVVIVTLMLWCVVTILPAAQAHSIQTIELPQWQPPDIPYCDKELWERIRANCDRS